MRIIIKCYGLCYVDFQMASTAEKVIWTTFVLDWNQDCQDLLAKQGSLLAVLHCFRSRNQAQSVVLSLKGLPDGLRAFDHARLSNPGHGHWPLLPQGSTQCRSHCLGLPFDRWNLPGRNGNGGTAIGSLPNRKWNRMPESSQIDQGPSVQVRHHAPGWDHRTFWPEKVARVFTRRRPRRVQGSVHQDWGQLYLWQNRQSGNGHDSESQQYGKNNNRKANASWLIQMVLGWSVHGNHVCHFGTHLVSVWNLPHQASVHQLWKGNSKLENSKIFLWTTLTSLVCDLILHWCRHHRSGTGWTHCHPARYSHGTDVSTQFRSLGLCLQRWTPRSLAATLSYWYVMLFTKNMYDNQR